MSDTQALLFNGASSYATLAPAESLELHDRDFTVEAWIRIDAWAADYLPILGTAATAPQQGLHLAVYERRPYMGFYEADTAGRSELALGTWYHLAWRYTRDGGEQAIFVNGVLDASSTGKGAFLGTDPVWIGRYADSFYFQGAVSELRIWRTARSAGEIRRHMHERATGGEADLVGVWPLADGAGETAANGKASLAGESLGATPRSRPRPPGSTAVRLGGVTAVHLPEHTLKPYTYEALIRPEGPPEGYAAQVFGPRRQVMRFDGSTGCIPVRNLSYETAGCIEAITVEAWVKTSCQRESTIASWDRSESWRLSVGQGVSGTITPGRVLWATSDSSAVTHDMVGTAEVHDGAWHLLSVTYDRATGKKTIYVDGELDREVDAHGGRTLGTGLVRYGYLGATSEAGQFDGGGDITEYMFDGEIAEIRIWDRARSQVDVQADRLRRLAGDEDGLVALWRLDEISSDGTVADLTGSGYDGVPRTGVTLVDSDLPVREGEAGLFLLPDGSLRHLFPTADGPVATDDTPAGSVPWNVWTHVAVVNGGRKARTLVNGEVLVEAVVSGLVERSDGWQVGAGLTGEVADLRIWEVARSPEDIAARRPSPTGLAGLVGHWPLEEASGSVASCVEKPELDGTVTGERVPPFSIHEFLEWNGTSSYLTVPESGELSFAKPGQSFTLELWVRLGEQVDADAQDDRVIVEKWKGGGGFPYALRYRTSTGRFVFARSDGTTPYPEVVSTDAFDGGGFHHVAAVKSGTSLRLYVDGEDQGQATDTVTGTIRGSSPLYAGARVGKSHFFAGTVSELRLWRRALSQDEIRDRRGARLSGAEADLAGYWPLDVAAALSGETLDELPMRDGVLRAAGALVEPSWTSVDPPILDAAADAAARVAPALELDGTAGAVVVPGSPSWAPGTALTVEAWVRPAATEYAAFLGPVVSLCDATRGWELRATDTGAAFLVTVGTVQHEVSAPLSVAEEWVHVAGSFDGTEIRLCLNGVPAVSLGAAGQLQGASGPLYLGRSSFWTGRRFAGRLSEVRLWNVSRSAAEIQAGLFHRASGDEPGLVGYWPLSEGEGTSVAHATDESLAGTVENAVWVAADLPPRVAPGIVPALDAALEVQELEAEVAAESEELRKALQRQKYRETRKAEIQAEIEVFLAAWNAEQGEILDVLGADVADREARIEALDAAQREADLTGVDALLDDVVQEAHGRIEQARGVVEQRAGNYRLGRVAMDLKFVSGAGGRGAIFPSTDTRVAGERMTSLELDFAAAEKAPEEETTVTTTPRPTVIPGVVGYTAAVAERKLAAAGYQATVHAQAVSAAGEVGLVVQQLPPAETVAPPSTRVRLFLGKAS